MGVTIFGPFRQWLGVGLESGLGARVGAGGAETSNPGEGQVGRGFLGGLGSRRGRRPTSRPQHSRPFLRPSPSPCAPTYL